MSRQGLVGHTSDHGGKGEGEAVRFAPEKGKLGTPGRRKRLLLPDKKAKLSISRTDDLDCEHILDEGLSFVGRHGSAEALFGWLEFDEVGVDEANLHIDYDEDPPRHGNVVGWPDHADPGVRRKRQLDAAEALASRCLREAQFAPPIARASRPPAGTACALVRAIPKPGT